MNLPETLQQELENPKLTSDDRILVRCQAAADFIERGQYEGAREALGDLWRGPGERPILGRQSEVSRAMLLLQCGALTSGIGSARSMPAAQEKAKDLISESLRLFESMAMLAHSATAQSELAVCYWRMGAFDEARVVLDNAFKTAGETNDEIKAQILIRRAMVETWACRYHDAKSILEQAEAFFNTLSDSLKAGWHAQMGIVLGQIGIAENRSDVLDRAIIEYTAATFHYQQSDHHRYVGNNLNNLAMLLYSIGRHSEAHRHLDEAHAIFSSLQDLGNLAQVNETRARVLLAEHRYDDAKTTIEQAANEFEVGGEQSCLTDALTIQATVLARLGDFEASLNVFRRAVDVGATAGATENAGHASLSMIEEHGVDRLSDLDLFSAYKCADELLKDTQYAEDISRLRACARIVMRRLMGTQISDSNFALKTALRRYEARFIEAALSRSGGKISQAATMLGLSHQTLSNILKYRQNSLQDKRLPPTPRRRSIVRTPKRTRFSKTKPITVLYVEDDKILAKAIKQSLEKEGFSVDVNWDGSTALHTLQLEKKYDVLIFDNEMDGINGVGLARQAREIHHRMRTPIIVFSSADVAAEAYRAGVNLFLQKPEEVRTLAANIKRLLAD